MVRLRNKVNFWGMGITFTNLIKYQFFLLETWALGLFFLDRKAPMSHRPLFIIFLNHWGPKYLDVEGTHLFCLWKTQVSMDFLTGQWGHFPPNQAVGPPLDSIAYYAIHDRPKMTLSLKYFA